MSTRERICKVVNSCSLDEVAMQGVLNYLMFLVRESSDDAFCAKLVQDYLDDTDPEKHECVSIDEFMHMCGVTDDDLQTID
jgi:hypothetical protein